MTLSQRLILAVALGWAGLAYGPTLLASVVLAAAR